MNDAVAVTDELVDAVRAVPGVDELYPAGPILQTVVGAVVGAVVSALTDRDATPKPLVVDLRAGKLHVSARIGVDAAYTAPDVCRRVHDVIAEFYGRVSDPPVAEIAVTVARIG